MLGVFLNLPLTISLSPQESEVLVNDITVYPANTTVVVGYDASLGCAGNNNPTITWYKDTLPVGQVRVNNMCCREDSFWSLSTDHILYLTNNISSILIIWDRTDRPF